MAPNNRRALKQGTTTGLLLLVTLLPLQSTLADDNALEREQLATLVRQLDLVNQLADHASTVSPQEHTRYHFDYARLREDLQRVRTGVADYLTPERAQPRDPAPLSGAYTRDIRSEPQGTLP